MKEKKGKLSPLIAARVHRGRPVTKQDSAGEPHSLRLVREEEPCTTHEGSPTETACRGDSLCIERARSYAGAEALKQAIALLEKMIGLATRANLDATPRTDSLPLLQSCMDKTCDAVNELLTAHHPRLLKNPLIQKLTWLRSGGACALERSTVTGACRLIHSIVEVLNRPVIRSAQGSEQANQAELEVIRENHHAAALATHDPEFAATTAKLTRLDALTISKNQFSRRTKPE